MSYHQKRLQSLIDKVERILPDNQLAILGTNMYRMVEAWTPDKTKDRSKISVLRRTIYVSVMESIVEETLGSFCLKFGKVKAQIDSPTDGLWIDPPADKQLMSALGKLGTRRMILSRRFKFNSTQTSNLIRILVSSDPEIRGNAKLDLLLKLDSNLVDPIFQTPS
ncbi:unnamed protein product [Acanthoscelides obtectus]|uniref:Uncharacterized protein n=1 Tax=Acanthoscelides obtectus TaxID=200917 RepID=A0A9P0JZ72_ACAOB|nr:unnamed protein product [Acanthoscelides obtectus]CAK1667246.1 hypothetical protein AOBTE_LOCUS25733 [Acanthoscelides obtectus]